MVGVGLITGAGRLVASTWGKSGLVGKGVMLAAPLVGIKALRSVFQGEANGDYQAGANGNGAMTGWQGGTTGTLLNPGFAIQHPVKAIVNSGWALADTVTFHKIPALGKQRLAATKGNSTDIGNKIARGQYDASFANNFAGDVIGGTLTAEEKAMLSMMDPKDRARYLLQKKMQEKAEMAALCSNLQGLRHSNAMAVIGNIRA